MGSRLCVVATDSGRHAEDGLAAIEHGLDALIEKPLSVTVTTARDLCRAAEQGQGKLYVGCVLRFSESLNRFKELLDGIGRPHSVRIECQSYLPEWRPARPYQESYSAHTDEGGVLLDLIHEIDYAGWLFGWPAALHALVRNCGRLQIQSDESADLLWETEGGCVVSIRLDYLSTPARRLMTAFGEEGALEWNGVKNTVTLLRKGAPPLKFVSRQTRDEMFSAQARAFIQASRGAGHSRLVTCQEGIKALAVCDAARRASTSRREESVEYL